MCVEKKMGDHDIHNLTLLCIRMRLDKFLTAKSVRAKSA